MYFCSKCGSVMVAKGGVLVCPRCGSTKGLNPLHAQYLKKSTYFVKVHEKRVDVEGIGLPPSAILDDKISCPRCGHKGVYYWRRHKSSAESSDIIERVYRCRFCGYSWSEMD